jgi:hypothetical protein
VNVGDVITAGKDFATLPEGAIAVQPHGGILRRAEGSVHQGDVQAFLPATLVWLPGHPPRPERVVKVEALREYANELEADADRLGSSERVRRWARIKSLRIRANRIERGEQP